MRGVIGHSRAHEGVGDRDVLVLGADQLDSADRVGHEMSVFDIVVTQERTKIVTDRLGRGDP